MYQELRGINKNEFFQKTDFGLVKEKAWARSFTENKDEIF